MLDPARDTDDDEGTAAAAAAKRLPAPASLDEGRSVDREFFVGCGLATLASAACWGRCCTGSRPYWAASADALLSGRLSR